jgi:cysteinyl-tRNA synthetase
MIGKLIERGHAYAAEGHVLFDVPSDSDYGKLSRRPLDEMIAGARVEVAPYKRAPTDFVLWKPSGPDEPAWDSPWGRGRPGWHLECSAMSWQHLGESFDIHGGGIDLVFPHHENEIAQTCSAFGHDVMANYWMHNGHLQVEGEKMSKSLGNFVTIHELLHTDKFGGRSWPGEVLRLALLRTHYRQPIDFTVKALEEAQRILDEWYQKTIEGLDYAKPERQPEPNYLESLADDFNTPAAIARLHWLADDVRTVGGFVQLERKYKFRDSARMIGLLGETPKDWFRSRLPSLDEESIKSSIQERLAARAAKNWKESDRIRDELAAMGIALKDNKDGTTTWEVKR